MRDSFVFYRSFYEAISELPAKARAEIYAAVFQYSFYGEEPEMSAVAKAMFTLMKPNIDNANQRYDSSVENGKKGGRPKKQESEDHPAEVQPKPNETQSKPGETQGEPDGNHNDNVDVDVDANEDEDVNADAVTSGDAAVAAAPRHHFSREFETLWAKYPRREGKKKAREAFIKARKEGVPLDDITRGVETYAGKISRDKTETQYIAAGSTWFNQRRWEDDYSVKEVTNGYECYENLGIVL